MLGRGKRTTRGRTDFSEIVGLSDRDFIALVHGGLTRETPAFWAQCVVSYENLTVMLAALAGSAASAKLAKGLDEKTDIVDVLIVHRDISPQTAPSYADPAGLRQFWNWMGLLIIRATERAMENGSAVVDRDVRSGVKSGKWIDSLGPIRPEHESELAEMWICLAKGCSLLPAAIAENVLWDESEKAWFANIKSEEDGIKHCLSYVALPRIVWVDYRRGWWFWRRGDEGQASVPADFGY